MVSKLRIIWKQNEPSLNIDALGFDESDEDDINDDDDWQQQQHSQQHAQQSPRALGRTQKSQSKKRAAATSLHGCVSR